MPPSTASGLDDSQVDDALTRGLNFVRANAQDEDGTRVARRAGADDQQHACRFGSDVVSARSSS